MKLKRLLFIILVFTLLSGCTFPIMRTSQKKAVSAPVATATSEQEQQVEIPDVVDTPEPEPVSIQPTPESPTQAPTDAPTQVPAPSDDEINPLTGLPVDDPTLLGLSPILVSVSNFPVSVRPQSGLSFAPHVFEFTIGEGMTRFLAIYYGSYGPEDKMDVKLGSIRSGRLPYEQLRTMYDGMVVMAGAAPEVGAKLNATVFRETITFQGILELAQDRTNRKGEPEFENLTFDASAPAGGIDGTNLEIIWNRLNRVRWTYDAATGKYLREQDKADGKDAYYPAIDKLTETQLAFDNVVVMAVDHQYLSPTKIEMSFEYIKKEPAIFFRDGKAYKVFWTSLAPLGPIRFINEDGSLFPYKPGNTWFEVISSMDEIGNQGNGAWMVDFFNP